MVAKRSLVLQGIVWRVENKVRCMLAHVVGKKGKWLRIKVKEENKRGYRVVVVRRSATANAKPWSWRRWWSSWEEWWNLVVCLFVFGKNSFAFAHKAEKMGLQSKTELSFGQVGDWLYQLFPLVGTLERYNRDNVR
jgi:hypothetical protein